MLLQDVCDVLVALKVSENELKLGLLELVLEFKAFVEDSEPVDAWVGVPEVDVEDWLRSVDVEGADLEHFHLHASHIGESGIIQNVDTEVILHQIQVRRRMLIDLVDATEELPGLDSLRINIPLPILHLLRDLLAVKWLSVSLMESRYGWASAIQEVVID